MLGHKTSLNKFKRIKIMSSNFSNNNGMKLDKFISLLKMYPLIIHFCYIIFKGYIPCIVIIKYWLH